jgi:hypothetical protein
MPDRTSSLRSDLPTTHPLTPSTCIVLPIDIPKSAETSKSGMRDRTDIRPHGPLNATTQRRSAPFTPADPGVHVRAIRAFMSAGICTGVPGLSRLPSLGP